MPKSIPLTEAVICKCYLLLNCTNKIIDEGLRTFLTLANEILFIDVQFLWDKSMTGSGCSTHQILNVCTPTTLEMRTSGSGISNWFDSEIRKFEIWPPNYLVSLRFLKFYQISNHLLSIGLSHPFVVFLSLFLPFSLSLALFLTFFLALSCSFLSFLTFSHFLTISLFLTLSFFVFLSFPLSLTCSPLPKGWYFCQVFPKARWTTRGARGGLCAANVVCAVWATTSSVNAPSQCTRGSGTRSSRGINTRQKNMMMMMINNNEEDDDDQ